METWLRYDVRTPPFGPPSQTLVGAAIEQIAWADEQGFDTAMFGEHHGSGDGYLPSPLTMASAVAARTSRIRLQSMVLAPLHNPLTIAESAAIVDLISGGRSELTLLVGYVPSEFVMFGVDPADRAEMIEEMVATLRAAFTGEPFVYRGRRCSVTPRPVRGEGIPLYIGGAVPVAARRAARIGDGFFPTVATPELLDCYRNECRRLGTPVGPIVDFTGPLAIHVTNDPEKAWSQVGRNFMYEMNCYGKFAKEAAEAGGMSSPFREVTDVEALAETGVYQVVTPEQCIELAKAQAAAGRVLVFSPLSGGMDPDLAWESLELFADKVLPHLK